MMECDPWNRVHIPRPGIQCQVTVPLGDNTETYINQLVERCLAVHSSLKNETLKIEVATLDSILYVFHHRLSFHKPYLALKQVQQCTKRLCSMGLEDSIQEIIDLCPKKTDLEVTQFGFVPSQPIIELVSMKILGACKLLLRLMDCCCKAFHLCLQYLKLEEYIVLNVVILGLLSRLWVLYRGVLKQLIYLYNAQIPVLKEVSAFQKMPYFKDFNFPDEIEHFLGPVFSNLATRKLSKVFAKKGKQLLNKLFPTSKIISKDADLKKTYIEEPQKTLIDLGQPIKMTRVIRGNVEAFDIKALLQPVKGNRFQDFSSKQDFSVCKNKHIGSSRNRRKTKCVVQMVPVIQKAESFRELSEQLMSAVNWCRDRNMRNEAVFFRNRFKRCQSLQYAEALGYSLKKKLQCWKKSISHHLHEGNLNDHPKAFFRIQIFPQSWKFSVILSRKQKLHKCCITHSKAEVKTDFKSSPMCLAVLPAIEEVLSAVSDTALCPQTYELLESGKSTEGTHPSVTETNDIDDIFSSIGI